MRTTVSIIGELLAAAKRRAQERGQTLGDVLDAALRRELSDTGHPTAPILVPVFRDGTGPRPGIDLTSNRSLNEALDDGVEFDDLR